MKNPFDIIQQGDEQGFEVWLKSGNVMERGGHGESLLHAAVKHDQVRIMQRLLAAGIHPNMRDDSGQSALHLAVMQHKTIMLSVLLDAKADPNGVNNERNSALFLAASFGCAECVALLVSAGAIASLRGGTGWTAMIETVRRRKADVLMAMLKCNMSTEHSARNGWTPMMYAAWDGAEDMMETLLEHGASLVARSTMSGWTALYCATVAGHVHAVRWLVEHGIDPCIKDDSGWEALAYAELHQKTAVSHYLKDLAKRHPCGDGAAEHYHSSGFSE